MNFDYGRIDVAMQKMLSVMTPVKVILFGSAARGEASDDGDIDLPIASGTDDVIGESIRARLAIDVIGAPVDILVYIPEESLERSKDRNPVVYNAVEEGRVPYDTI